MDASDPVFVLHGDHGEAFGEHGHYGHGDRLYEETIRVPLIVGNADAGDAIRRPVSLRSIPERVTILADGDVDPESLTTDRTYAISERGDICVRGQDWKYYVDSAGGTRFDNLRDDPTEQAGTDAEIGLERQYVARLNEVTQLERATRTDLSLERL